MPLKRSLNYFSLFLCLTLCVSCFDIIEEINLNKDGSGSLLVTFNMSKSKTKIASLMMLDSINGHKIPSEDDINEALKDVVLHLEKAEGITNIKQTKDFKNYIFTVSCDFATVESVNGIFREIILKQNKEGKTNFSTNNLSYDASSKIFKRAFTYDDSIKESFDHLQPEDRKVFNDACFTSIYRFNTLVDNVSNSDSKIAPNKKAVMLRLDAMSFIQGKKTIQNTIQLVK